jgi:formiminotetrahydrofolate cyclodeaminase
VAGLTAHAAAEGAYYNVLINLPSLEDQGFRQETLQKAETLVAEIARRAEQLRESVLGKLEASESGQR